MKPIKTKANTFGGGKMSESAKWPMFSRPISTKVTSRSISHDSFYTEGKPGSKKFKGSPKTKD